MRAGAPFASMVLVLAAATAQVQSVAVHAHPAGFDGEPRLRREGDTLHLVVRHISPAQLVYVRSGDGGSTWAPPVHLGTPPYRGAFAVAGLRVYVLGPNAFSWSNDDGATWQSTPNASGFDAVDATAAGSQCDALLFGAAASGSPLSIVHVQTLDGGATWSPPRSLGTSWTGDPPQMIADGSNLHVWWNEGQRTHYQRSTDRGATWLPSPIVLGSVDGPAGQLVAAGAHVHLFRVSEYLRSTDGGASWLPPLVAPTPTAATMAVADANVYLLFFGPMFGLPGMVVLRSHDHGATWAGRSLDPAANYPIARASDLQAHGNVVCAAWCDGPARKIALSTDAGASWQTHTGSGTAWMPERTELWLRPPAVGVCWRERGFVLNMFLWLPPVVDLTGDLGATWHLQHTFGDPLFGGPALFAGTDDDSGLLWGDATPPTGGSTAYATHLYWATLHGHEQFGPGKPGTLGIAPRLVPAGAPLPGGTVTVALTDVVGGTTAMHGVSFFGAANTPLGSGVLLLAPPMFGILGMANGPIGAPGAGTLLLPMPIPNSPTLHRQRVTLQGFALDPGAAEGFSSSAGLQLLIL